jgi:hypothetical protein
VLAFTSTASIAPDVPEMSDVPNADAPVAESPVPTASPTTSVAVAATKKPANAGGWVEVRLALSHHTASVIPQRSAAVPYASMPATPPATHRAAVKRRVPQYHRRPVQYHGADVTVGRSEPTRALLVPMHRDDGVLRSADEAPPDGPQVAGDACLSEPPICPDLCGDVPFQNSLQNVAEIVRCIVNATVQEIGSGDTGSPPDFGAQVPAPAPGDTSAGQYQGPPCEQGSTTATPAAPPAGSPAPDAAPTAIPTPASGSTTGPSAPVAATSSGPPPTKGGAGETSNADDGWQLVRAARRRPPASRAVVAAASVSANGTHEVAQARVATSHRTHKAAHPARKLVPGLQGDHHAALATASRASEPGDPDAWPLRTMIALLVFASLAFALAAVAKVTGAGAAASVAARLGSRSLSRGGSSRANRKRGIRYRE